MRKMRKGTDWEGTGVRKRVGRERGKWKGKGRKDGGMKEGRGEGSVWAGKGGDGEGKRRVVTETLGLVPQPTDISSMARRLQCINIVIIVLLNALKYTVSGKIKPIVYANFRQIWLNNMP